MFFEYVIADILDNKKRDLIVTELFVRGRKLNIFLSFITRSCFTVRKSIRINSTLYFIMKIPKKQELQQISSNHSSDIDIKEFMNLYKNALQNHIFFSY